MTIRAGFLSGGMRRAEMLHIPDRDVVFYGCSDAAYTSQGLASSHLGYDQPFLRSTPGVIGGVFDYNKNARRLLTYSVKDSIQMMDADRWAFIADVIANPTGLTCIRFSNSGQYFALCSSGSGVRVYDTTSFREIKTVFTDKTPTWACWSQGDRYLAVSLVETPYIRVIDTATWTALSDPGTLPAGRGNSVGFSRGGEFVAVGHDNYPYFSEYRIPAMSRVNPPAYPVEESVIHIRYSPLTNCLFPITAGINAQSYYYDYGGSDVLFPADYLPVNDNGNYVEFDERGFFGHSDDDGGIYLAVSASYFNIYGYYNVVYRNLSVPAMRPVFSRHAIGI